MLSADKIPPNILLTKMYRGNMLRSAYNSSVGIFSIGNMNN